MNNIYIPKFNQFLNESRKYKYNQYIYIENNSIPYHSVVLWTSYTPGSGTTKYFDSMKKLTRSYFINKPGDKNEDSFLINKIIKWSEQNKPTKKTKNGSLYKIPVYQRVYKGLEYSDFDIFGGTEKPDDHIWILIQSTGKDKMYTIVNFFLSKREAIGYWNI